MIDWDYLNHLFILAMWILAFVLLMIILVNVQPTPPPPKHAHPVVLAR